MSQANPNLLILSDGGNYHVQKWMAALVAEGLRVTLASFHPYPKPVPGVEFVPMTPPVNLRGRLGLGDFLLGRREVNRVIEAVQPDVLMASYATHYGSLGARSGFRPLIVQTWTMDLTVYPFKGWKRWLLRPLVRHALGTADVVTTDGPGLAAEGRRLWPGVADKLVPTTWGIRLADYDPSPAVEAEARAQWDIPAGAPVVLSPRGVFWYYRPEIVLPALLQIMDERPDAYALALTVTQERTEAVQALLDQLDAHPQGRVADRFLQVSEMRGAWAMADVFVSAPVFDGISEAVLEGMYAGGIPIVSDIPSNRSFLTDGTSALFVPGESIDDLAATLHRALDQLPALKQTLAPRNRAWIAEHASVEGTARQLAGLVRRLAQENQVPT
ncbi:MAG: glycosyltransferase family 4 protein [Bacteroidota bacterium]